MPDEPHAKALLVIPVQQEAPQSNGNQGTAPSNETVPDV